jgi:hypothetical protein
MNIPLDLSGKTGRYNTIPGRSRRALPVQAGLPMALLNIGKKLSFRYVETGSRKTRRLPEASGVASHTS